VWADVPIVEIGRGRDEVQKEDSPASSSVMAHMAKGVVGDRY
jgi:hypothetical protein